MPPHYHFDNTYSVRVSSSYVRVCKGEEGDFFIAIYFEKFRIFLKPWKYTGILLAQPSIEWMFYDIKRYFKHPGANTILTLDL